MRVLLLLGLITGYVASSAVSRSKMKLPTETLSSIAEKCFQVSAENTRGNMVYSPMSFRLMLSMIFGNSSKDTTKGSNVHSTERKESARREPDLWNNSTNDAAQYDVKTMISQTRSFCPSDDFVEILQKYNVELENINKNAIATPGTPMKDKHGNSTSSVIAEIIGNNDPLFAVQFANTITFKGDWANKFNARETTLRVFFIDGWIDKNLPTMRSVSYFRQGNIPAAHSKFIELPYMLQVGSQPLAVSMFIILPDENYGVNRLIRNLAKVSLEHLRNGEMKEVKLFIPKFKIESAIDLAPCFHKFGSGHLLTNSTILDSISSTIPLKITNIVQKNVIDVDERGTQATSEHVSYAPMRYRNIPEFAVDHPFVALIVPDNGQPLFTIVVKDPTGISEKLDMD